MSSVAALKASSKFFGSTGKLWVSISDGSWGRGAAASHLGFLGAGLLMGGDA